MEKSYVREQDSDSADHFDIYADDDMEVGGGAESLFDCAEEDGDHLEDSEYRERTFFLKQAENQLRLFRKYHSITDSKKIYDLMGKTASGLLRDIAASTKAMTLEQRRKKETMTRDVFVAYIGYFCAQAVYSLKQRTKLSESAGQDLFTDVWYKVYTEMLKWVKKYFNHEEKDKKLRFFRKQVFNRAYERVIDIKRSEVINTGLKKYDPEAGKKVPVYARFCPFEIKDVESGEELLPREVEGYILRRAREIYELDELRSMFIYALETCCAGNRITREDHDIVCLYFGIGDGYDDPMSIKEIAGEINRNYSYVRNHLLKSGEEIRKIMQEFYSGKSI